MQLLSETLTETQPELWVVIFKSGIITLTNEVCKIVRFSVSIPCGNNIQRTVYRESVSALSVNEPDCHASYIGLRVKCNPSYPPPPRNSRDGGQVTWKWKLG
jgi:hypothetical protein